MGNTINLLRLSEWNARALADFSVEPASNDIRVLNDTLVPVLHVEKSYLRTVSVTIEIRGRDLSDLIVQKSRFLSAIDKAEYLTVDNKIFYRGKFTAANAHKFHNQTKEFITLQGLAEVTGAERTARMSAGFHEINNTGTMETPLSIKVTGASMLITGLTDKSFTLEAGDYILDNGLISTKHSSVVEMPRLQPGRNTIRLEGGGAVETSFRERYR